MYCDNCGHNNREGANFCSSCGAVLTPPAGSETTVVMGPEAEGEPEEEFSIPLDQLEEGKAILVVRRGPEAGTNFLLDQDVVTCGRDPRSTIFLDDFTVSRKHAEIRREGAHFSIVDVGSLNGTFVNRQRVDSAPLANGDELQIGKFKLVFFTGGAPAA